MRAELLCVSCFECILHSNQKPICWIDVNEQLQNIFDDIRNCVAHNVWIAEWTLVCFGPYRNLIGRHHITEYSISSHITCMFVMWLLTENRKKNLNHYTMNGNCLGLFMRIPRPEIMKLYTQTLSMNSGNVSSRQERLWYKSNTHHATNVCVVAWLQNNKLFLRFLFASKTCCNSVHFLSKWLILRRNLYITIWLRRIFSRSLTVGRHTRAAISVHCRTSPHIIFHHFHPTREHQWQ